MCKNTPKYCLLALVSLIVGLERSAASDLIRGRIESGGVERTYLLFEPTEPSAEAALVVALHGGGGSAEQMSGQAGNTAPWSVWNEVAERDGFFVVYPDGVENHWNDCRGDSLSTGDAEDVRFIRDLLGKLTTELAIDTDRIYATGTSNGGLMSFRLGQELTDDLAAISAVAANRAAVNECEASGEPIPILIIHGTDDPRMPIGGGQVGGNPYRGTVLSMAKTVQYWLGVNSCLPDPKRIPLPDLDPTDGSVPRARRAIDCTPGVEVALLSILGGGHALPSISEQYPPLYERLIGNQNHDLEGVEVIWKFFARHTR